MTNPERELLESQVAPDPLDQFRIWYQEFVNSQPLEPTAVVLATASGQGRPAARVVLMKSFDSNGFTFFTNYEGQKSKQIKENPWGELLFFWQAQMRQVRISGTLGFVSSQESDDYFASRPYESQIGAWASEQSREISGRDYLDARVEQFRKTYPPGSVPRPPHWGGFRLKPQRFEFWQGRTARLHDRLVFSQVEGMWELSRLAP